MTGLNAYRPYRNMPQGELEATIDGACDADAHTVVGPSSLIHDLPLTLMIDLADELAMRGDCGLDTSVPMV